MRTTRTRVALLAAMFALALAAIGTSVASASDTLGPKPAKCGIGCWGDTTNSLAVSRLGDVNLSPHIARVGQKITAKFKPLTQGLSWDWPVKGVGCKHNSTTCTFTAAATEGWAIFTLGIGNSIGAAESQDAYAVPAKGTTIVQGYVTDRSGGGIGGAEVSVRGSGGSYHVQSGGDGFYNVIVKPGRYEITPSGGPSTGKTSKYQPSSVSRDAVKGGNLRADFVLQAGLQVKLSFDHSSVPADGLQIVTATITTTRFGKPDPNVTVSLRPQEKLSPAQALAGPRAALCGGGNVIWPTGGLFKPDALPVDVTTDAQGKYQFTLDAGTVPGSFSVDAWAKDGFGKLITDDLSAVTDDATLTMTSLGSTSPDAFPQELAVVASSGAPLLQSLGSSSGDYYRVLTQLAATTPGFGGLAFGHSNSPDNGDSVLVYSAAHPPHIDDQGHLAAGSSDAYIIQGNDWIGTPAIPLTDLSAVFRGGRLQILPTLVQWTAGAAVPGWNLKPETPLALGAAIDGFGWGYHTTTLTGGCS